VNGDANGWRLDHVVLAVRSLSRAVRHFESLGFTVTPGGVHQSGRTHNALITFADDSYLELLALRRWWQRALVRGLGAMGALGLVTKRLMTREGWFVERLAAGGGLADFAVATTSVDAALAALRQRGVGVDGPLAQGRTRPDGQRLSWKLAMPRVGDLPFIIEDVSSRSLRVPAGPARRHRNGVTGIAGVVVAVSELDASVQRYRELLGVEPEWSRHDAVLGGHTARFTLRSSAVTLATPTDPGGLDGEPGPPSGGRLRAVRLVTARPVNAEVLDVSRTEGARIELVPTV
jgi:catechol 2,3-dioxygenase-like lactoylglutathione lyase family enzyme